MTNIITPIQAAFEFQRQSINQSQQLFEQSLKLQQNAFEAFLHNGISTQRSAQKQGTELAKNLFNAQYEAFQSALNDEEIKEAANQQFAQTADQTQQLLNVQYEQGIALAQQLFDAQYDAVAEALDDEQFRTALEQQFEEFDAVQSEAWDEFESEFAESFEELSAQQKELVEQSVEAFLDAQQDTQQQTVQGVQQGQQIAQMVQQQTEQAAQAAEKATEVTIASAAEGAEEAAQQAEVQVADASVEAEEDAGTDNEADEELEAIEGLGATYADRLRNYGIESITHLVQADSETVADAAQISEDRANEWITSAQSRRNPPTGKSESR